MTSAADQKNLAEAAFFDAKRSEVLQLARKAQMEADELDTLLRETRTSNMRNRVLDFATAVTKDSTAEVIDQVSKWTRQSNDPVTIIFNSPGGEVLNGLALFDFLRSVDTSGTPVTTVVMGYSASMAGVLLQAGSRRVVSPNSYFLIHEVSSGARGTLSEVENAVKFTDRLNDRLANILAEKSQLSANVIKKKVKAGDWWLDAEETLKYGLADEIGYR